MSLMLKVRQKYERESIKIFTYTSIHNFGALGA